MSLEKGWDVLIIAAIKARQGIRQNRFKCCFLVMLLLNNFTQINLSLEDIKHYKIIINYEYVEI